MVNSRDKGTRGEYAVIKLIEELLGIKLKRDVEQYRQADRGDLILAEDADWPFCVEVKTYSSSSLSVTHRPAWWQQVEKASAAHGLIPVLFYKYDRYEWRVVLKADTVSFALGGTLNHEDDHLFTMDHDDDILLTTDVDGFAYLAREILAARAG
jgi:hypothetical protein